MGGVNLRERDTWKTPGLNAKIILKWIFRKCHVTGMDWFDPAEDTDRRWALVNEVMNLRVP